MHGVLEIQHARQPGRFQDHQVAAVIVAMHVATRLGQHVGQDLLETLLQHQGFLLGQRHALVSGNVPVRVQHQLAQQQFTVVLGKHAGLAGALQFHQRLAGCGVQAGSGLLVQLGQVGAVAQVVQQQEAPLQISGVHPGDRQARGTHDLGRVHEGPAVFLRGRRVHHDGGARADRLGQGGLQPEIAAKACVTRCRGQRGNIQGMAFRQAGKPCLQFFQPGVVPGGSRGGGRGGRGGVFGRHRGNRKIPNGRGDEGSDSRPQRTARSAWALPIIDNLAPYPAHPAAHSGSRLSEPPRPCRFQTALFV